MVTETVTLINTIKKFYPVIQFFKDRYFPDGKTYYSEKALIETKKGGRKVAPFVIPVVNGIVMESEGYSAEQVDAPYIAPKMEITSAELELKKFGENPYSGRSPEQREKEVQAEHMDDLRKAILRRFEWMCTSIITEGKVQMRHYASADDAVKDQKYQIKELRFYARDGEFGNRYWFKKDFSSMTAQEKIQAFYEIHSILSGRGVRATDIVMTADVSMQLMTDPDFLEYYNKMHVNIGEINQKELPEGVSFNGTLNINGVVYSLFTYAATYEDMDGEEYDFLPPGTIAFLRPAMGTTAYAQVSFIKDGHFVSHAEKIVPRVVADENNNILEVQAFSRPVPYPLDWDGWMVANIYDHVGYDKEEQPKHIQNPQNTQDSQDSQDSQEDDGANAKTEDEINAMTTKKELLEYAASVGLEGLSDKSSLQDLKAAIIAYQQDL